MKMYLINTRWLTPQITELEIIRQTPTAVWIEYAPDNIVRMQRRTTDRELHPTWKKAKERLLQLVDHEIESRRRSLIESELLAARVRLIKTPHKEAA